MSHPHRPLNDEGADDRVIGCVPIDTGAMERMTLHAYGATDRRLGVCPTYVKGHRVSHFVDHATGMTQLRRRWTAMTGAAGSTHDGGRDISKVSAPSIQRRHNRIAGDLLYLETCMPSLSLSLHCTPNHSLVLYKRERGPPPPPPREERGGKKKE